MKLSGLHILLTYRCVFECDHCFVWGGPRQTGTLTLRRLRKILEQTVDLGTVDWVYFEGGEPFLHYAVLLRGVRMARESGFQVGIVSNGYWATDENDARECLRPLARGIRDLSISRDRYHGGEEARQEAQNACAAAAQLGIPVGVIRIAPPAGAGESSIDGPADSGEYAVRYRGRAVATLTEEVGRRPWNTLTRCPCEDLRDPGRVHLDPLGHVHVCQGISVGNVFRTPLKEICESYDPEAHPVIGPLLAGGPAELVRRYRVPHAEGYADACHLCYEARCALRERFPDLLAPDQMYGGAVQD